MGRQIGQAVDAANQQISDAQLQLQESIDRRNDRENIRLAQVEELRGPTEDIETARQNLARFREDQHTASQRARQDALEERDYLRQIEDTQRKTADHADSASTGFGGIFARQVSGSRSDPMAEAHRQAQEMERQHQRKLDDTREERTYEDMQRDLTRAEQNKDRNTEKTWAQTIADIRQQQAVNVIQFEDDLAGQHLAFRIGPGGPIAKERDARIQAIQDTYTEQEKQSIEKFNQDLARQLILRNLSTNGPEATQTQSQLLAQLNTYRANLGLPAQAWPFQGGMSLPGTATPSQAVANVAAGGLTGSPNYQSGAGPRIVNVHGSVFGERDLPDR